MKRLTRRETQATLDLALAVCGQCYRDAIVIAHGAPDLVHALDRSEALAELAAGRPVAALCRALTLVTDTRARRSP